MKNLVLIFLVLFSFGALAQKDEPTIWQTSVSKKEVKAGETLDLIFTAEIKEGWYLYSSDFDKDLGPVVAEFRFDENDNYELVGDIKPVGAKSKTDEVIWMGTYTYFTKKAEFRQTIRVKKDKPAIKVKLSAQACNDVDGRCVPVFKQFTFNDIKVVQKEATQETPVKQPGIKPDNKTTETVGMNTTPANKLDPSDFPTRLEYLKAEKAQLVKNGSDGSDQVVTELKDFVKKYRN